MKLLDLINFIFTKLYFIFEKIGSRTRGPLTYADYGKYSTLTFIQKIKPEFDRSVIQSLTPFRNNNTMTDNVKIKWNEEDKKFEIKFNDNGAIPIENFLNWLYVIFIYISADNELFLFSIVDLNKKRDNVLLDELKYYAYIILCIHNVLYFHFLVNIHVKLIKYEKRFVKYPEYLQEKYKEIEDDIKADMQKQKIL
jgi:hypothetical protein